MKLNVPQSRIDYIKSLNLSSPITTPETFLQSLPTFSGEPEEAKVVGGSTVSFISGVPKSKQQDVLNSTLLAQLAANHAFDREKETEQWYKKYREVLENVGWIIENFQFQRQSSAGSTVKLDKVALGIFAAAVSGNELAVLTATLTALEDSDPESKEVTLFDGNGSSGDGGNFQLGTASVDPNGNVQMSLGAFYFDSEVHKKRFLFITWETKSINIYAGAQSVLLNEQIYSSVRQTVIEKLGDKAQTYVADLPI